MQKVCRQRPVPTPKTRMQAEKHIFIYIFKKTATIDCCWFPICQTVLGLCSCSLSVSGANFEKQSGGATSPASGKSLPINLSYMCVYLYFTFVFDSYSPPFAIAKHTVFLCFLMAMQLETAQEQSKELRALEVSVVHCLSPIFTLSIAISMTASSAFALLVCLCFCHSP